MQQPGLYRKEALRKLSSPEQLDNMLTITSPRSWMAVAAVGLIFLSLLVWGCFGSVTSQVAGQGIIIRPGGIARVASSTGGQVVTINTVSKEGVNQGQMVVEIRNSEGETIPVYSNYGGRVLELFIREGDLVSPGSLLFSMEVGREDDLEKMETILFVPVEVGQKISPGMEVNIAPTVVNKEEFGFMVGKVRDVSEFPSTFEGLLNILGNEELAMRLAGETLSVQVTVELLTDEDSPSGYRWTSGQGPDISINSGTICQGFIITQKERPAALVFPALER
ncbi:NHLP bacteriocin system secretion protein [Candidatus Contubernalis alkaliaceticus]|uniref:NHLP bacteriocin system secretion protein n=1 Tax=Candidatus Contubernalis alkaliaceticus TaxID=338645 RepID=UPI001F4BDFBF|nr:NHLP bacteriocin system secretion protein [Candidatus Contubernalis alkalaceticus]UNC93200.1 NHLP bacteriocin system secretion protein [Candidatus Contubernalis alkalaceticus]